MATRGYIEERGRAIQCEPSGRRTRTNGHEDRELFACAVSTGKTALFFTQAQPFARETRNVLYHASGKPNTDYVRSIMQYRSYIPVFNQMPYKHPNTCIVLLDKFEKYEHIFIPTTNTHLFN